MQKQGNRLRFSSGDLVGHLSCVHRTHLELAASKGLVSRPHLNDPFLDILRERGLQHENAYIDYLVAAGRSVTRIGGVGISDENVAETLNAMRHGAEVIVQPAFRDGGWIGRPDVLLKTDASSALGPWSYNILDTKLARQTKGATLLQLCLYAELLEKAQGRQPEYVGVVAPWSNFEPGWFRVADYAAYFRLVKASFEAAVGADARGGTYPDPVEHCDVCRWQVICDTRRRTDDHLSLVAGISKGQVRELQARGIETVSELAALPLPLPWKPHRGSAEAYERVREQARVQVAGRAEGRTLWELLPLEAPYGLCRLPEPSRGDIFFDIEGDPFVGEHGLEYLFGYAFHDQSGTEQYVGQWAISRDGERAAFEQFIDFVSARLAVNPDLHIYHYAPYEPAALKRLMGRYGAREEQVDTLLRAGRFIDLYSVVKQSILASVESYSIKRLEPMYEFTRTAALPSANQALMRVQASLELNEVAQIDDNDSRIVQDYNKDDCLSTWRLRDWLEQRRAEILAAGARLNRPSLTDGVPGASLSDWQQRVEALAARLTRDVPARLNARDAGQQGRWLLANMLDWHRREKKATWWEFFRLRDLTAEELCEEKAAVSGLTFISANGGTLRAPIHRYAFPPQETEIRGGENVHSLGGDKFGRVEDIQLDQGWVDIKKRQDTLDVHPEAIFAHDDISTQVLADSLMRLGEYVAGDGLLGAGARQPARDLLLREPPRCASICRQNGETSLEAALRLAAQLDSGVLPIQGPPGAGKTYTAARMICAMVRAGRKVGVTANSHKVIRNVLDAVLAAAEEMGGRVRCGQKVSGAEPSIANLTFVTNNMIALGGLGSAYDVLGATPWLWASPDAELSVDVLFIDEAAQMAFANALAVSQAAPLLILLGDPQQLEQPIQGCHPDGTDVSALDHLLDGAKTISDDRGLFLDQTWRLHPSICAFTSEMFYEGRLHTREGAEAQRIVSASAISGAGLRYMPVAHTANTSCSPEEASATHRLVQGVLHTDATWIDRSGRAHPLTLDDILIVAPYNAQVHEIAKMLPGARVGTVDKFQGQEAPLVIFSMATSSPDDAPRGMEFLYSPNRLNVATSRAKCLCILVGSPAVFQTTCRSPRQMLLANAFCRYLEMSGEILDG